MVLSSRLAYFEGELLVDSRPAMMSHYLKGEFAGGRVALWGGVTRGDGCEAGQRPADRTCRRRQTQAPACLLPYLAADLLGFVPADWLLLGALGACGAAGGDCAGSGVLEWLPLLRLLHLARLYRVRQLFSYLVRAWVRASPVHAPPSFLCLRP